MNGLSTFVPNNRQVNLLVKLFAAYRAKGETAETLRALRDELGADEFANFEADLAELMKKSRAWEAVQAIMTRALGRKREKAMMHGAYPQITPEKVSRRMRLAEEMLRKEKEV